jgi:hypothetical protein
MSIPKDITKLNKEELYDYENKLWKSFRLNNKIDKRAYSIFHKIIDIKKQL